MKRSIILEGVNGSGKSTLSEHLSRTYDLPVHHAGPAADGIVNAFDNCVEQIGLIKKGCIMDRVTPISRVCYENSMLPFEVASLSIFMTLMSMDAVIIYCMGEGPFTEKEYYPEGHMQEIIDQRDLIKNNYQYYFKHIGMPFMTYDWKNDDINEFTKELTCTRTTPSTTSLN